MRCQTSDQRRINNAQPWIEYQTVNLTFPSIGLPRVMRDVPLLFSKPYHWIGVCSIKSGNRDTNIWLHFQPFNLPIVVPDGIGSVTLTPTGAENWIPLSNTAISNGRVESRWIKFNTPVQSFYFDADHPNGGVGNGVLITFMGSNDLDYLLGERQ
jgi:hypothetical protein